MYNMNELIVRGAQVIGLALICNIINPVEPKRSRTSPSSFVTISNQSALCSGEECSMDLSHFYLYYNIKRTIESEFDIKGKELIPIRRSMEVLMKRFKPEEAQGLKGSKLVRSLIGSEPFVDAMDVFDSADGGYLVDLYKSSISGKHKDIACSEVRAAELEKASALIEKNSKLASVFSKVHNYYVKKSARKCLKSSCTVIGNSMTKIESVLDHDCNSYVDNLAFGTDKLLTNESSSPKLRREFEGELLELCRFFQKTNSSTCVGSVSKLREINLDLTPSGAMNDTLLEQLLTSYTGINAGSSTLKDEEINSMNGAKANVYGSCQRVTGLLNLNLAGLKWYRNRDLISEQDLADRLASGSQCQSLSYWMQIDQLCAKLSDYYRNWTKFHYIIE